MKDGGRPDRDTMAQIGHAKAALIDNLAIPHDCNRAAGRIFSVPSLEQLIDAFRFRHQCLPDHFSVAMKSRVEDIAGLGKMKNTVSVDGRR